MRNKKVLNAKLQEHSLEMFHLLEYIERNPDKKRSIGMKVERMLTTIRDDVGTETERQRYKRTYAKNKAKKVKV